MSDSANVRQYFTRAAVSFDSLYEEKVNFQARFINRRFRRDIYERFLLSIDHVRKFSLKSILDVGCGSGRYAVALAQLGVKRIVGLDISEGMIALARSRVAREWHSDSIFEFVRGDFMQFKSNETFQLVLAMGVFDYVRDPLPVLQRMGSLATHTVIASFPSISWYRTPIPKIRYLFKRCPVYFYQRSEIEAFGEMLGFAQTDVHKIEGAGQDYFVAFYKPDAGHGEKIRLRG
jgi:2-polyprenyl-3-methyl-5-hydroxy-6-metoxy-1,4-benzoquinol methylase